MAEGRDDVFRGDVGGRLPALREGQVEFGQNTYIEKLPSSCWVTAILLMMITMKSLSLQFCNCLLQVLLSAMEISQGTTQELVSQEESDGRDINTLVQKLHGESVPKAVESDMLVYTGGIHKLRDFVIEDVWRKGREDGSLLPDRP